ncbi:3-isopropylmalate dehydratase, small subunit [Halovivax ruber XH-70]|uniref:3-isopropylmalate dehydratase n=1 Tax=Halovivax ruber (strain DSM 18193 / JCM 13892 / XH-70) TaxID=797302 RepID=L0IEC8_HALRX|nr:3-isopropylmalate dehydratase small subunit [Halovivax ruber]AGB17193.1 3-isopropylmalate dehydratase, small subunit [Halovivax ruber XH-70]
MNDSDGATTGPEPVERVRGTGVPIRGNEIDTDQILPARFLKAVTFEGLGQFAFFDQRFDEEDEPLEHPFNDDRFEGASVLVVNSNFGCGSSREHAPQALMRWGIDAIVGESFAEIFAGNCLGLGIPTVTAGHEEIAALQAWVETNPDDPVTVSVADEAVTYGETTLDVTVDEAQRRALVDGNWDTTALMRQHPETVHETAASLPYADLEAGDGVGRTVDAGVTSDE